jgi:hypothetical protein
VQIVAKNSPFCNRSILVVLGGAAEAVFDVVVHDEIQLPDKQSRSE